MSKAMYIGGADNLAHKVKKIYVGGSDGLAHKVKKVYIGDSNNIARLAWNNGMNYIFIGSGTGVIEVANENNYSSTSVLTTAGSSSRYQVNFMKNFNGEVIISRSEYNLYRYNPSTNSLVAIAQPEYGYSINDMSYGNGYYLCIAYDWTESDYYFYYATTLGTWTKGSYYFGNTRIRETEYSNGYHYISALPFSSGGLAYMWRFSGAPSYPSIRAAITGSSSSSFSYRTFWIYNGYIVVSAGNNVYYTLESSDMSTWTTKYVGYGITKKVVGKDRLVGINSNSKVCYSMDGINWTATAQSATLISYSEGVYYCVNGYKNIYASTDLSSWSQIATMTTSASAFLAASLDG